MVSDILHVVNNHSDRCLFAATSNNVRGIFNMLKAVSFRDVATLFISDKGMKVTVEDMKCVQANVFLQKSVFRDYKISENVEFRIKLALICECLNLFASGSVFGAVPTVRFEYDGYGTPLRILLEEAGVITDCQIKTMDVGEYLEFDFAPSNVLNMIIMRPETLRDTFQELDLACEFVELYINPDFGFMISAACSGVSVQTEFPRDSEVIEVFNCTAERTSKCKKIGSFSLINAICSRYRLSLLKPIVKALQISNKVSIRVDSRGFLSMQYLIDVGGETTFIEFFVSCLCN